MSNFKGGFLSKDNDVIDDRDKSSLYPDLMKTFFIVRDKTDGPIKCWEATVCNTVAYYLQKNPEDFKKILGSMDYSYIESIYGQVGAIDNIFEYYSYEDAFDKYTKWITAMEKYKKPVYRYGYELLDLPLNKYHCGSCEKVVEYPYTFDQEYKSGLKCPYCNAELYTDNQYRFKYGFNYSSLLNHNKLELVNMNDF